ncbi:hypothetical protein [Streptomyces abikoensis]|uniref:hypothetical protein n=1 Tax=Streptomyces abikoensis TaxID=97398 RepID=UPI0016727969|nr:hypothetical protein [Streptomyces abikoensis]GGP73609.1 hypothetical protein GCM10010214_55810 [Streptomyces abikoensis]
MEVAHTGFPRQLPHQSFQGDERRAALREGQPDGHDDVGGVVRVDDVEAAQAGAGGRGLRGGGRGRAAPET